MKKNAFSLAELLIVTFIVSVLLVTGIQSFKINDKSIKYLYSNTYYALGTALYNAVNQWIPENYVEREIFADSVKDENDEDVPIARTATSDDGSRRLCRALVEYINPVQNRDTTCHADNLVDITATESEFNEKPVQFTATNGVRFWISKRYPSEPAEDDLTFYLIFADLNGAKRPNSLEYEKGSQANGWKTKDPDIFTFAAMSNGYICPIGVAEVEPRYLTARVMYYDHFNDEDILKYSPISRSLIGAKAEAWGYYGVQKYEGNHPTTASSKVNITYTDVDPTDVNAMDDEKAIEEEKGLSFGGQIKEIIDNEISESTPDSIIAKIYAFLNGGTFREFFEADDMVNNIIMRNDITVHENNSSTNTGGYECNAHNIDHCEVVVDRYVY